VYSVCSVVNICLFVSTIIEFKNVSKSYTVSNRAIPAVHDINLTITKGETFGIIGQSGAGKSTLIRIINLLERPNTGHIIINGIDFTAISPDALRLQRQRIGMIFQHFNLLSSKTVAANIAFPLKIAGLHNPEQINMRVSELLDLVDLRDQANKYPAQLSGGQKQRVGIARALATKPDILLCDEATSALDPQTTQSVLSLLADINRRLGLTIVLITHEMDVIRDLCDRVAVLDQGHIVEIGKVTDVFLRPQHPTTRRFVLEFEHLKEPDANDDFAQVPGRIVHLTFSGNTTYQPILGKIARDCGIDFSILAGRIDHIKSTSYGQLTIAISGGNYDHALDQFRAQGISVEELRS
jgi:D-methionine transport system ATP-binding protein